MKAVIDRIEGELAVLLMGEDGSIKVNMPLILLPEGCKESDVLDIAIERNEKKHCRGQRSIQESHRETETERPR